MSHRLLALALFLLGTVAGCASQPTNIRTTLERIPVGMTSEEATEILVSEGFRLGTPVNDGEYRPRFVNEDRYSTSEVLSGVDYLPFERSESAGFAVTTTVLVTVILDEQRRVSDIKTDVAMTGP